jgi:type VI secretion system protein
MELTLTVVRYQHRPPDRPASAQFGEIGGTIGRNAGNDLVLPDPERWVSGHHAEIRSRGCKFYLIDTSTNGTYVNHAPEPVPDGQEIELHDADELSIGAYDLRVAIVEAMPQAAQPDASPWGESEPQSPARAAGPAPDILDFVREQPDVLGPARPNPPERESPPVDLADWLRPTPAPSIPEPDPFAPWPTPGEKPEGAPEPDHTPEENVFFTPPNAIPDDYDIWSDQAKPVRESAMQESQAQPDPHRPPEEPKPVPAPPPTPAATSQPQIPRTTAAAEARAQSAQGDQDYRRVLDAFFDGLGTGELPASSDAQVALMRTAGSLLRAITQGLMTVLLTRASFKSELRLEMTTIRSADNNPFKFSIDVEDALSHLLLRRSRGFLAPSEAAREAFDDIQAHEMAMIAGLRAALGALLARFDPEELERRFSKQSVLDNLLPIAKKAKYWDLFTEVYSDVAKDAAEGFLSLFRDEFNRAYEAQSARLRASRQRHGR